MNAGRIAWSIVGSLSIAATVSAGPGARESTRQQARARSFDKHNRHVREVAQLTPRDASDTLGQGFGASAAIEGDWIAVGAPNDSQVDYNAGAVYVFRRQDAGWAEHVKLLPDDGAWEGAFGESVAMNRARLVVASSARGSTEEGLRLGYVFVHDANGTPSDLSDDVWVQESRLLIPTEILGSLPCCCCSGTTGVGISGDRIVLGAGRGTYLGFVGFVAIFERVGDHWFYVAYLLGSESIPGDQFGSRVSVSGNRVAVGAPNAYGGAGEVYVFRNEHGGWAEEAKLSSIAAGNLGDSISLDGEFLAVAGHSAASGSVLIFRHIGRTWTQQAELLPPIPTVDTGFGFGAAIALRGRDLFIHARDIWGSNGAGTVFWYQRVGPRWFARQTIEASDPQPSGFFGGVMNMSGRDAVASGSAKVYVLRLGR